MNAYNKKTNADIPVSGDAGRTVLFNMYMPGEARLSLKKFFENKKIVCDDWRMRFGYLFGMRRALSRILKTGDTQPAIVVSVSPFIVSQYSDEFDCVIFLKFPDAFAQRYCLSAGSRLVSSCFYGAPHYPYCTSYTVTADDLPEDIIPGEGFSGRFCDIAPYIQLFWGKDEEKIREQVECFNEAEWAYVETLTANHIRLYPELVRDGFRDAKVRALRWFAIK